MIWTVKLIYLLRYYGPDDLFRNLGNEVFEDVSEFSGLEQL